jgi:type I restriction enzyme S subunit
MSFRLYESYRESGVRWLGSVPSGWTVKAIKHCFSVVGGSTPKSEVEEFWDGEHVWVTPADLSGLSGFGILDSARRITDAGLESCGTNLVPPGSIVLSTRAPIGSLAIAGTSLCTNQGCKSLVPKQGVVPQYFAYVLSIAGEELNLRGRGTTFLELSADALGAFEVVVPTAMEQVAIAAFLDRETAKIDALVEEQKRLIELLKEKRQAVISQAVTKGLDPSVPMKDSGVAWLGEVPAHWDIVAVKRISSIRYGIGEPPPYRAEGVPLIRATNVHAGRLYDADLALIDPDDIPSKRIVWLSAGDIIVVRSGAYTGDSAIIPEAYGTCIAGFDMVLRCRGALPRFVQYALLSTYLKQSQIDLLKLRAAQPHLNAEELGGCLVVVPTPKEQAAIADYLDERLHRFDELECEAEAAVLFLTERRSALISAAVTGKIDVRGLAPH